MSHTRPKPATSTASSSRPSAPLVTCPYCSGEASFLPSSEIIYGGRDFGPLYVCFGCRAWVGCHRGTVLPLGRLANAELRQAKRSAHDAFDASWRALHADRIRTDPTYPVARARAKAYKLLAKRLGISGKDCHIGMFDVGMCRRVVALCDAGALAVDQFS